MKLRKTKPGFQINLNIDSTACWPKSIIVTILKSCPHLKLFRVISDTNNVTSFWTLFTRVIISMLFCSHNCSHIYCLHFCYLSLTCLIILQHIPLNEISRHCTWISWPQLCMWMLSYRLIITMVCTINNIRHGKSCNIKWTIWLCKNCSILSYIIVIKHCTVTSHLLKYNSFFVRSTSKHKIHSQSVLSRVPNFYCVFQIACFSQYMSHS